MSHDAMPARSRVSIAALAALALGIAALASLQPVPIVAGALGAAAVVVAARTRPRMRADDRLRGAGFAGVGFVAGAAALAIVAWMLAFPLLAAAIG